MPLVRFVKLSIYGLLLQLVILDDLVAQDTGETRTRSRVMWDLIMAAMGQRDFVLAEARMDTMISWAAEDNDLDQLAYAYQAKGQMHFYRAEYDTTLQLIRVSQRLMKGVDDTQWLLGYNAAAHVYRQTGQMDSALYYLRMAERGLDDVGDSIAYVSTYNDLGLHYYNVGILDTSVSYYMRQLDYIDDTDSIKLLGTYVNLVKIYTQLDDVDNSHRYADLAVAISESPRLLSSHSRALSTKADVCMHFDQYGDAVDYAERAVSIHERSGLSRNALARYTTLARAYMHVERPADADRALSMISDPQNERNLELKAQYYLTALDIALSRSDGDEAETLIGICDELIPTLNQKDELLTYQYLKSRYYEMIGRPAEAYRSLTAYHAVKDSIVSQRNQNIAKNLTAKYETAIKEEQIASQRAALSEARADQRLLILVGLALLSIGGLLTYFWRRQHAIRDRLQQAEIESLKKENKIVAMHSLISGQEEERKRIAQDLHDNIGSLMTTIKMKVLAIQKDIDDVQSINIVGEVDDMIGRAATEIRRISHNMTPVAMELTGLSGAVQDLELQLREQGIETRFDTAALEDVSDHDRSVIIYRILQELVQNVAKHSQAKTCKLVTKMLGDRLTIDFSDDGVGIARQVSADDDASMGISSIKNRVEYLDGEMQLSSDEGTRYQISVPL